VSRSRSHLEPIDYAAVAKTDTCELSLDRFQSPRPSIAFPGAVNLIRLLSRHQRRRAIQLLPWDRMSLRWFNRAV
jgi:hypothetical protein